MRSIRTTIVMGTIASLCLTTAAVGQRSLERTEILEIFKELTGRPRTTWIPAGTIEATCDEYGAPKTTDALEISREIEKQLGAYQSSASKIERTEELQKLNLDAIPFNVRYKMANEYSMSSSVVVKYDGNRFYWEINVDSRQDSISPPAELAGNCMARYFDLNWNQKRIFAWDGQAYTTYAASGNHALVDAEGRLPRGVNGPLTAGLVPWGHGHFTYEKLSAAKTEAVETSLSGTAQIQMTVDWADGASARLNLDPAREYAVTSCTLPANLDVVVTYDCSGYRQVAGLWVPTTILVERRNVITDALLHSRHWTISSVDAAVPRPDAFGVEFQPDAVVEYASLATEHPASYLYSHTVDTDQLLAERLAYAATKDSFRQNCATVALKQAALELGKPISSTALAALVGQTGQTNLYELKQLAQGAGLYCRAVQTDLATLKTLDGAKAILHLPGENHFVLLDRVDDQYVWLIDLTNDMFYYRRSVDFFPMEWSDGIALLVSDRPFTLPFSDIDDATLGTLLGADGWDCTKVVQDEYWIYCDYLPIGCGGMYVYYWERYGCEPSATGTCTTQKMVRFQECACLPHPIYDCTIDCDWTYYHLRACR